MNDSSKSLQIARDVYANPSEALYDRYKGSKFFNQRFYNEAVERGESDAYFALLSQVKEDAKVDERFSEAALYDYERMMTELYKETLDDDGKKTARTDYVYNPSTNQYEDASIGLMSDKEYLDYQIGKAYAIKEDELRQQLEKLRKDSMSDTEKFWNSVGATVREAGEGALSATFGLLDALYAPIVATTASLSEGTDWFENVMDYYSDNSLTSWEKENLRVRLDEYERTDTFMRDLDGNYTTVGKYLGGAANSIGAMIPSMLIGAIPVVGQTVGPASFYGYIISNYLFDNATNPKLKDSPAWLKVGNAALNATLEWALEEGLAKILGPSPQDVLMGFGRQAGIGRTLADLTANSTGFKYLIGGGLKEGLEEFLQDFGTGLNNYVLDQILKGNGKVCGYSGEDFNLQTLVDSFVMGALTSVVMTGAGATFKQITRPTYIQTANGVKKLSTFNNAYFHDYVRSFHEAMNNVMENPREAMQNGNARIAYDMYKSLGSYFSEIGEKRFFAAEKLLALATEQGAAEQWVSESEAKYLADLDEKLSSGAITQVQYDNALDRFYNETDRSEEVESIREASGKALIADMLTDIQTVLGQNVQEKYKREFDAQRKKLKADKRAESRLRKNGVTKSTGVYKNGEELPKSEPTPATTPATTPVTPTTSPAMTPVASTDEETRIRKTVADKVKALSKDYDWVFTTDGHIALAVDDTLYVSEDWLKNYSVTEIHQFIAQTKLVDLMLDNPQSAALLKDLVEFDKDFTKQQDVDAERALLDFMFNPIFAQKFMFSSEGQSLKKYKNILFRFSSVLSNLSKTEGVTTAQKNMIRDMIEKFKSNLREPTVKAILQWGYNEKNFPGANEILTKADRDFIHQYKLAMKAILDGNETVTNAVVENVVQNHPEVAETVAPLAESTKYEDRLSLLSILFSFNDVLPDAANGRAIADPAFVGDKSLASYVDTVMSHARSVFQIPNTQSISEWFTENEDSRERFVEWLQSNLGDDVLVSDDLSIVKTSEETNQNLLSLYEKYKTVSDTYQEDGRTDSVELRYNEHSFSLPQNLDEAAFKRAIVTGVQRETADEKLRDVKKYQSGLKATLQKHSDAVKVFLKFFQNVSKLSDDIENERFKSDDFNVSDYNLDELSCIAYAKYMIERAKFLLDEKNQTDSVEMGAEESISDQKEGTLGEYADTLRLSISPDEFDDVFAKQFVLSLQQDTKEKRKSFHAGVRRDSSELLAPRLRDVIVDDKGNVFSEADRAMITIDDIINDPARFLTDADLKAIGDDRSPSKVYSYLRRSYEESGDGISIDRMIVNGKPVYVFVNDAPFEQLYNSAARSASKRGYDTDLVDRLRPKTEGATVKVGASEIFSPSALMTYKLYALPPIEIGENVKTEAHKDRISIHVDANTTNDKLLERITHETRHYMQKYFGLETGFTPDFKPTPAMVQDVKKHVPELFSNEAVESWAREAKNSDETVDEFITRYYTYYTIGGELNAYNLPATSLVAIPAYATSNADAKTTTIVYPWSGQGDGGVHTINGVYADAMAAKDYRIPAPQRYKPAGSRNVSVEKANKSALIYWVEKRKNTGTDIQVDRRIQDLVVGLTDMGQSDFLKKGVPKGLANLIKSAELDYDTFGAWFGSTHEKIPDDIFQTIAKTVYNNTIFKSMKKLESITSNPLDIPARYWAVVSVMKDLGMSTDQLQKVQDAQSLDEAIASLESFINNSNDKRLKEKLKNKQFAFLNGIKVRDKDGTLKRFDLSNDESVGRKMRTTTLAFFNGSFAGAYTMARMFRDSLGEKESERLRTEGTSLNATVGEGDNEVEIVNNLSDDARIIAPIVSNTTSRSSNIDTLVEAEYDRLIKKYSGSKKLDWSEDERKNAYDKLSGILGKDRAEALTELEDAANTSGGRAKTLYSMAMKALKTVADFRSELETKSDEELKQEVQANVAFSTAGVDVPPAELSSLAPGREEIQRAIKNEAKPVLRALNDGSIRIDQLDSESQKLFERGEVTNKKTGVTTEAWTLAPSAWQVGKGAFLKESEKKKSSDYSSTDRNQSRAETKKRSTATIETNLNKIREIAQQVEENKKAAEAGEELKAEQKKKTRNVAKKAAQKVIESNATLNETIDNKEANLEGLSNAAPEPEKKDGIVVSTIEPEQTEELNSDKSDVPPSFTVFSQKEMPEPLKKIYSTSFGKFAETRVQMQSVDAEGNLLKEKNDPNFVSVSKHEVMSLKSFFEINADVLNNLTREDVLEIVDFIVSGVRSVNGSLDARLQLFSLFTLAYIQQAQKLSPDRWNLDKDVLETIRTSTERLGTAGGHLLKGVQDVLNYVDPDRLAKKKAMEDEGLKEEDADELIEAIRQLQEAKENEVEERYQHVLDVYERITKNLPKPDDEKLKPWSKPWLASIYRKIEAFRYLGMLSSPATWVRNSISNVMLLGINKASDRLADLILTKIGKKGYREGQYDIVNTDPSEDARNFITAFVDANPLFEYMYQNKNRYTSIYDKKTGEAREKAFINEILKILKEKYGVKNETWSSEQMQWIEGFIRRRISDDKFVNRAVHHYYERILTIESERGNIDLSQGMTDEAFALFVDAVVMANEDYMHKRSFVADALDGIRENHKLAYNALKLWQPFLNSQMNWFVELLKLNPLSLIKSIYQLANIESEIAKNQKNYLMSLTGKNAKVSYNPKFTEFRIRRDFGKGVLGFILTGVGALLAAFGLVKIKEDDEKPYVYVGEVKFDISDIFGSSSLLMGAAITQKLFDQNLNFLDALGMAAAETFDGFVLNDFLQRHRWDDNPLYGITSEIESYLGSYWPQIWQLMVKMSNNKKVTYSQNFVGLFEKWLNTFVPLQPLGSRHWNPYNGQMVTKYSVPIVGQLAASGIIGPKIYWDNLTETEIFARANGVSKGELSGEITVKGVKKYLDRQTVNEMYGKLNQSSILELQKQKHRVQTEKGNYVTLPWDKLSDKQKKQVIDRQFEHNADAAKIFAWVEEGHRYYASDEMYVRLRKLGITKGVYRGNKGFVE